MEENKLIIQNEISNEEIRNLIYTIREKQVMLDTDVAKLYHYETRRINEAVKRNLMLSGLLKNEIAIEVSIKIVEAFVEMRKFITSNRQVFERLTNVEYKLLEHDKKFNKEYSILKVAKTNKFHDRFIVIDNKEMYYLGASIKDLGKRCFGINRIEDIEIIRKIINS